MALARTGDREAFEELVRRRQSWLRTLLRRCCGDPALADDLAQQTFLQAWKKLRQLRDPERFGPWLKRLGLNAWLGRMRGLDPLADADPVAEDGTAAETPGTADSSGAAMIAGDLDAALNTLAAPVRLCVVLAYHEGFTHEEIVELTKLPLGTVKSHVRRGTQKLRQQLLAYEDA